MSAVALYFIYSLSSIGHALYWYKFECTVLLSSTPAFPQVQAAIKKKVEKQKKRTNDQGGGGGDAQAAARNQKSKLPPMTAAEAGEDSEALEEQLEELMEGPRRREKEKEEEPVDLLPIVDSVFGQVGVCMCVKLICFILCSGRVCVRSCMYVWHFCYRVCVCVC